MLTVKEAAARATVSEGIVRGWIRDGALPHFRLGAKGRRGKICIAVEDLDALVASFKVEKKGPSPAPVVKVAAPKSNFKHLRVR